MQSFVQYSPNTEFPIQNLPYGIFSTSDNVKQVPKYIFPHIFKRLKNNKINVGRYSPSQGQESQLERKCWICKKSKHFLLDRCFPRTRMFLIRLSRITVIITVTRYVVLNPLNLPRIHSMDLWNWESIAGWNAVKLCSGFSLPPNQFCGILPLGKGRTIRTKHFIPLCSAEQSLKRLVSYFM